SAHPTVRRGGHKRRGCEYRRKHAADRCVARTQERPGGDGRLRESARRAYVRSPGRTTDVGAGEHAGAARFVAASLALSGCECRVAADRCVTGALSEPEPLSNRLLEKASLRAKSKGLMAEMRLFCHQPSALSPAGCVFPHPAKAFALRRFSA